jgi:hypothetical protein
MWNLNKRLHVLEQRLTGEPPATLIMPDGRMRHSGATMCSTCSQAPAAGNGRRPWNCSRRASVLPSPAVDIFSN